MQNNLGQALDPRASNSLAELVGTFQGSSCKTAHITCSDQKCQDDRVSWCVILVCLDVTYNWLRMYRRWQCCRCVIVIFHGVHTRCSGAHNNSNMCCANLPWGVPRDGNSEDEHYCKCWISNGEQVPEIVFISHGELIWHSTMQKVNGLLNGYGNWATNLKGQMESKLTAWNVGIIKMNLWKLNWIPQKFLDMKNKWNSWKWSPSRGNNIFKKKNIKPMTAPEKMMVCLDYSDD